MIAWKRDDYYRDETFGFSPCRMYVFKTVWAPDGMTGEVWSPEGDRGMSFQVAWRPAYSIRACWEWSEGDFPTEGEAQAEAGEILRRLTSPV